MRGWHLAHLSLMHGWIPATLQLLAVIILVAALGRRVDRAGRRACPALVGGVDRIERPRRGEAVAGWRSSRWWRRTVALLAVPLTVLGGAATLNGWIGYVPTVGAA